jgi:hypothetical protein
MGSQQIYGLDLSRLDPETYKKVKERLDLVSSARADEGELRALKLSHRIKNRRIKELEAEAESKKNEVE